MDEADFFREVDRLALLVQDELVDDYVRGALAADERAAFERRLGGQRGISDKMLLVRALQCVARRRRSPLANVCRLVSAREQAGSGAGRGFCRGAGRRGRVDDDLFTPGESGS